MFHDELRRKWTYAFLKVSSGFDPRKIPKSSSAISGFSSRPQTRVSNIILTDDQCGLFDLPASVKLSSFCPCFVLLLVWALLFNNSCKSKLIGGKSIWKLFAKWPTPTDRESKCLCMSSIFTWILGTHRVYTDLPQVYVHLSPREYITESWCLQGYNLTMHLWWGVPLQVRN